MFELHADLGQGLICLCIAIIGWFIRREIVNIGKRLDKHEERLFDLHGIMQNALGQIGIMFKLYDVERKVSERR